MSSQEHRARTPGTRAQGSSGQQQAAATGSNAAMQGALNGPAGRVFSRILEAGGIDVSIGETFGQQALREYIDETLQFAEGEMFRGTKVSGGAEGLFQELDKNRDGAVDWSEFSAMTATLVDTLVPEGQSGQISEREIINLAEQQFDAVPGSEDGSLSHQELQRYTEAHLPDDISHRALVAQLSSRLALDAIDTSSGGRPIGQRTISRQEWVDAAVALARK